MPLPVLAIAALGSRVAPVLNWVSRFHVYSVDSGHSEERVVELSGLSPFEQLRDLHNEKDVKVLICGALSPDLLQYGEHLGIDVIFGVAGGIEEVHEAFRAGKLDDPGFRLPGCGRGRGYRGDMGKSGGGPRASGQGRFPGECLRAGGSEDSGGESSSPPGSGRRARKGGMGAGPGGECACPKCGKRFSHQRGIPCARNRCPECGIPLVRA